VHVYDQFYEHARHFLTINRNGPNALENRNGETARHIRNGETETYSNQTQKLIKNKLTAKHYVQQI
jgi:hypothetical protein